MTDGTDTDRIIGALEESKRVVTGRLTTIEGKIDDHAERLVRVEGKVDDLNNIRKTVRTSFIRWFVPYILVAGLAGYLASLFNGG
jgi:hypothetical protein